MHKTEYFFDRSLLPIGWWVCCCCCCCWPSNCWWNSVIKNNYRVSLLSSAHSCCHFTSRRATLIKMHVMAIFAGGDVIEKLFLWLIQPRNVQKHKNIKFHIHYYWSVETVMLHKITSYAFAIHAFIVCTPTYRLIVNIWKRVMNRCHQNICAIVYRSFDAAECITSRCTSMVQSTTYFQLFF